MRFDRTQGKTASELLQKSSVDELGTVLKEYGDLRQSRRLAEHILKHLPETTLQLRSCVEEVFGYKTPSILPQVFQSLRIFVNDEIGSLTALLTAGPSMLAVGGR